MGTPSSCGRELNQGLRGVTWIDGELWHGVLSAIMPGGWWSPDMGGRL